MGPMQVGVLHLATCCVLCFTSAPGLLCHPCSSARLHTTWCLVVKGKLHAAGLVKAVELLQPVKDKVPKVSWADLMQMASALAVKVRQGWLTCQASRSALHQSALHLDC